MGSADAQGLSLPNAGEGRRPKNGRDSPLVSRPEAGRVSELDMLIW